MIKNKIAFILSARFSSKRLPGKALLKLGKKTVIGFLIDRLKNSKYGADIILATSSHKSDDLIVNEAINYNINYYRGSLENVLKRYAEAAEFFNIDTIVRITGDNPFINSNYIDEYLDQCTFPINKFYTTRPSCPKGLNVEIFSKSMIQDLNNLSKLDAFDKEHVTNFFYKKNSRYEKVKFSIPKYLSYLNKCYSIDTAEDYKRACKIIKLLQDNYFSLKDLVKYEN